MGLEEAEADDEEELEYEVVTADETADAVDPIAEGEE